MTGQPLAALRVIEIGGWVAGPLAGRLLADLGADVTRLEPPRPTVDPRLAGALAAGKEVLDCDLGNDGARQQAKRLIGSADVVIDNARPGALARLGIDAERLRERRPELVWLSLPGHHPDDPQAATPAWEGALAADGGLHTDVSPTRGLLGLPPSYTALPLASVYAAVIGAVGVVAALIARERDGVGDHVHAPLAACLAAAMSSVLMRVDGQPHRYDTPPLPGPVRRLLPAVRALVARSPTAVQDRLARAAESAVPALMTSYACADGRLLYVFAVEHDRLPLALLDAVGVFDDMRTSGLGAHDLYGPARRDNLLDVTVLAPGARVRLRRALTSAFARRSAAEWEALLVAAGVPCAVQQTTEEWLDADEPRAAGLLVDRAGTLAPGPATWSTVAAGAPHSPAAEGRRPLEGLTVLDLSSMVAGPVCARTLAELGADVVKVESPRPHHGPRMTCWYALDVHRGKQSALLDLADARGRDAFLRLADGADIVVDNLLPDALTRLGLDPATVQAKRPGLLWTSIGAFDGPTSPPHHDRRGYDPVLQAATGVMLRYGGGRPELHGIASCVDALTGYLGALGACAAVLDRARSGSTAHVRTSLAAGAQLAQVPFMLRATDQEPHPPAEPSGPHAMGTGPTHRLYRARDGWLFLAARPDLLAALLEAVGAETDDGDPEVALGRAIARLGRDETIRRLNDAGAGARPVRTAAEVRAAAEHAGQQATVAAVRDRDHPAANSVTTVQSRHLRFARLPALSDARAVKPGSDTREVLAAAVGAEHAAELIDAGVAAEALAHDFLPA